MKCLTDGTLRAYLDRELPEPELELARGHLTVCDSCGSQAQMLSARAQRVASHLAILDPPHSQDDAPVRLPSRPLPPATRLNPWLPIAAIAATIVLAFLALPLTRFHNLTIARAHSATPLEAATIEEASRRAGFSVQLPTAGVLASPRLFVTGEREPNRPRGVIAAYGKCTADRGIIANHECVVLQQTPAPAGNPEPPAQILQLAGMSATSGSQSLLWTQDSVVFSLSGGATADLLAAVAKSIGPKHQPGTFLLACASCHQSARVSP